MVAVTATARHMATQPAPSISPVTQVLSARCPPWSQRLSNPQDVHALYCGPGERQVAAACQCLPILVTDIVLLRDEIMGPGLTLAVTSQQVSNKYRDWYQFSIHDILQM